ncbi:cobalamin biosynthesis protein [Candidatus Bathyarchaeota archaeon A05DMB-2]|nr:cobalamin biosynthesis protein [Candidatus Bathyarchaeota archaeon A05DMB-2]
MLLAVAVLVLAIVLDLVLGDPSPNYPEKTAFKLHPTVLMGKFTKILEPHFKSPDPQTAKLLGVLLALTVIVTFAVPVYLGLWALYTFISVFVYAFFGIILLKLAICIKLETDWAKAAAKAIQQNDLTEAKKYSHFSRRDSKDLNGAQISSAVIESMAENLIDFKLSPILAFALFGVTGAIAFRAVNTLDGMVGFKDPEHLHTGWFSANLDHVVNFIPSRLTGILIIAAAAILGKDYRNAWAVARRDHQKTPSRNHGWPMAAMAGALCVQLEKPGQYVLGDDLEPLSPDKILLALKLRNMALVLCVLLSLPIILVTRLYFLPI